ncbi:MAG: hypothetical protein F9K18_13845 [Thermoanaerobaculia bacterium]|nr:MAG: hypothetical protein F9K18_13845 [Thermoanaerobaculia bacterium]
MNDKQELLRHFLAALAYRTQKALRDAPEEFGAFRAAPKLRTPHELVAHMDSVLGYAITFFVGGGYRVSPRPSFEEEVARFHRTLAELARHVAKEKDWKRITPERLLQGPLADAMSHAGQLAMLRRLAGDPVPPEDFIYAEIDPANLGPDQPLPARPDADWPERP